MPRIQVTKPLLEELYWVQGMSMHDIENYLGYGRNCLQNTFEDFGVRRRTRKEAYGLALKHHPKMRDGLRPRRGAENPQWKGGRRADRDRIQVLMAAHPRAHSGQGYVYEHILVWERVHNKPLPKGWVVHHLNGIGSDNRPENLVGMPGLKHIRVLAAKAQRIRELEAKVHLLEKALEAGQMIFKLDEN